MENRKTIKILIIIILIALILLIVKIKVTTTPTVSNAYNTELNTFNNIINTQTDITNKLALENVTVNNKKILSFNNYNQINSNKENINKKQPSSPTLENSISNNNKDSIPKNTIEQSTLKTVDIVEHQMKNRSISGIVKNNTDYTVKNLQITADCYDKDNNKLSTATTYLSELEPGETWKFDMWTHFDTEKYKNLKVTYK